MKTTRRQFLRVGLLAGAGVLLPRSIALGEGQSEKNELRIALCHLAAKPGELASNRSEVAKAVEVAAREAADWIVTPELCVSGYGFVDKIGTDWIQPQPGPWMKAMMKQAKALKVTLFLSHPERDSATDRLYNTVFVIGPDGKILGSQKKIRTLKHGSEAWSSPGETSNPFDAQPFGRVGILVCAVDGPTFWSRPPRGPPANTGPGTCGSSAHGKRAYLWWSVTERVRTRASISASRKVLSPRKGGDCIRFALKARRYSSWTGNRITPFHSPCPVPHLFFDCTSVFSRSQVALGNEDHRSKPSFETSTSCEIATEAANILETSASAAGRAGSRGRQRICWVTVVRYSP